MEIRDGIIFIAGVAIGAIGAWIICKDHYESIVEEELESIKKEFSEYKKKFSDQAKQKADLLKEKPFDNLYASMLKKNDIPKEKVDYSAVSRSNASYPSEDAPLEIEVEEEDDTLELITMYEFNEPNNYAKLIFNYYSNGIFSDEANHEVDISKYLGKYCDNVFIGNCKGDDICFRNNALMTDIAIVKETMTYEESLNETYK